MRTLPSVICLGAGLLFAASCTEEASAPTASAVDGPVVAAKKAKGCTSIQSGELLTSTGDVIETGYDDWGYNYQAHMFNSAYCHYNRDPADCGQWEDVDLIMKWNEPWLSNKDCDGDKKLDRHFGFPAYIGSGAWLTNHQSGTYDEDGETCKWTYFVKIVAPPADAVNNGGTWYGADGVEIGPVIWGQFATIQSVYNDPCAGLNGTEYLSPAGPGFGKYKP